MEAYIRQISCYLPPTTLSNHQLVVDFPEWSVEKIAEKVGVNTRHIAADDETAADMAVKAAEALFSQPGSVARDDIDFVLLCTQSPDYHLPTSACIIQHRLGLRTDIGALDFNLGCSGFVYGLAVAKGLVAAGIARNILLLTAETYSKYLHPRDKGNRTIFGDAATATVVATEGIVQIGEFALGTDGRGAENLMVKTGASRCPAPVGDLHFDENNNPVSSDFLHMNGSQIFMFTQKNVPVVVRKALEVNNMQPDDVDLYVMHQANTYMLEFLRKKMKISPERYYIGMAEVGNTVSNSIPLALADIFASADVPSTILICGFGVGYSWGATILHLAK